MAQRRTFVDTGRCRLGKNESHHLQDRSLDQLLPSKALEHPCHHLHQQSRKRDEGKGIRPFGRTNERHMDLYLPCRLHSNFKTAYR
jgi:hypothetical protein